ncbi:hypothetical protein CRE_20105 [Caenorhabditis remanei]|uniref:DNA-directed DNA polymerase n=1 Tax=Caenorhabditis remanei TaxID=31234 RepID=E3NNP6_CAERE|nr:hypothetical protein CRE_20105 [Caenorhabditis remanei]
MLSKLSSSTTRPRVGEEEQIGGASVRVVQKTSEKAGGRYHGTVETVTLALQLSKSLTTDPQCAETFADTLVQLVKKHDPFKTPRTRVGLVFESDEIFDAVGLTFREIKKVRASEIVESMSRMSQSSRSPLELDVPNISVRITYLNPPAGSGKRKFDTGSVMDLTAFEKRPKHEESLEKEKADKTTRSNMMPNEVLEDCLFHALHQSLMYHQWKQSKSLEDYNKYRSSIRKTYKKPGMCSDVYEAVKVMKEEAEMTKSNNFDFIDVDHLQKTVFSGKYQIIVFCQNSTTPYYRGPYVGEKKSLVLYLSNGHYNGVRSICALLKTSYYCFLCNSRTENAVTHYSCPLLHRLCGKKNCPDVKEGEQKKCERCTVVFRSIQCYENHIAKGKNMFYVDNHDTYFSGPNGGKSRCDYTAVCKKCDGIYYTNKGKNNHQCGAKWCSRCNCKRTTPHKCNMPKSVKNEKKLTRKRVYFDIEVSLTNNFNVHCFNFQSRADESTGQQHPVLFVALRCCPKCSANISKCLQSLKSETCEHCAPDGRLKIIECVTSKNRHVNVGSQMTKWLFADHHRGRVVVAHNASGYDAQFILENIIASNTAKPKLILEGTKLVFLEYNDVRLLDSMKFLTMSLASLGKSFEVDSVKGDFPVLFIKPEHYDYNGSIPQDKWYNLENKNSSVKKQLLNFLESERKSNKTFNFVDEIMRYCYNDVYILAKAMNIFEKEFETMTDVCLLEVSFYLMCHIILFFFFQESTTAASAAALVFRRNHLDPEKPIVLDVKPSISIKCSVISQKYLAWFSKKENVSLSMSTTYGEEKVNHLCFRFKINLFFQIGKYRVDGFVSPCEKYPDGLVIEFFGCYWHAHSCSYSQESMIGDMSAKEIWVRDKERLSYLRRKHPVKVVWECEVNQELAENHEMHDFFENYEPVDILQSEKSLAGGRTEVFQLQANNFKKVLRYLDVVSLYPTVMKHEAYPIGAPENVSRSTIKTPMTLPEHITFRGFISCNVLPPRHLRLPVLPIKYGGKLLFGLCKQCCKENCQTDCVHNNEERSFNGTFTTVEIQKALSVGYTITEVYHGIKYEHWVENNADGEGGLFTSFINQMMEEKIYSSGWPSNVKTDEEKNAFCDAYLEKEHIHLSDRNRFKKNPGKRAVAKLMLNSLWGKFAQNVDRDATEIIIDPMEFWKLVYDTNVVISIVRCVNDVLVVKYRKQPETMQSLKTSAMQLASFTTSYARLRLYDFMERVGGENIIYTGKKKKSNTEYTYFLFSDTDSIIYAVPDGTQDPLEHDIGPYLGQLTDELDGKMTEFVSLGPKTYCYKDLSNNEEKIVRKAKGITINAKVEKRLSFETMKHMVEEVVKNIPRTTLNLPQHIMYRDNNHRVYSRNIVKEFKYTFNKRRLLTDGSTLPFGYCGI